MNREEEIFAQALMLPRAERAAFLARASGDDQELRVRIEELLEAHAASEHFMGDSGASRLHKFREEKPGDVIGRYTLLEKLGEGGCGVVYLAAQSEPVRRRVALKIIKVGMDSQQVIARFEAERQALAMMDHPDIARVFDAGATETGRPYFAMEYVDGVPITRFADEHNLTIAARLELFARVCLALQHAHQKGIVHRDLKPSNILVAEHDGVASPKVIDFGIAKATQGRLTDHTLVTAMEQFIGTPAYMSPEQAERRDLDIDTRSDIYSLGVLLYELLTGRPPFDPKSLVQAGIDEIRRIIREVDPPRPSMRIATLTHADRATVARLRGAGVPQLSSTLRGDLDWIVMRCLEKSPERRYGTAQDLAADVRRHLHREPVMARPPSTGYRMRKFVSRHRFACASVAAIALALMAGTIVSVTQAVRATQAERDALRRQEEAEALLMFMLGDFRTELQKIGKLQLLDTVGNRAMGYFAALDPRDLTDAALTQQAKALTQIGEIRVDEARYNEAAAAFTIAYHRLSALVARHPMNADMLFERAQAEYWIGFAARMRGDAEREREWFTRYRNSAVTLEGLEGPTLRAQNEVAYGQHNLAVVECDRGNLTGSRTGFLAEKAAVETLRRSNPNDTELQLRLADIVSWLGTVAERDGDYMQAIANFSEMSSRYQTFATREPAVPRWRLELARSFMFIGNAQTLLGRFADGSASYEQSKRILDVLVVHDPQNRVWQRNALDLGLQQAALLIIEGKTSAATSILDQTRKALDAIPNAETSSGGLMRTSARAWQLEGRLRFATRQADASSAMVHALELGELLIKETRSDSSAIGDYAQSCVLAGRIAAAAAQPDAAQRYWKRALDVLAPRFEGSNDWRFLDPAVQALVLLGKPDQARPMLERLRRFGYHSVDPFAESILGFAASPVSSTKNL